MGEDIARPWKWNDFEKFIRTSKSLSAVGFSDTEKDYIYQILAGILYAGEFELNKINENDMGCFEVRIVESEDLDNFSTTFGLKVSDVQEMMCTRKMTAGGKILIEELSGAQSLNLRKVLIQEIYSRLFQWIMFRINENIKISCDIEPSTLGIFDIFGFENFEQNSLEQLCINYANEKCLQLFVDTSVTHTQTAYQKEGILWPVIDVSSVQVCEISRNFSNLDNNI